MVNYYKLYCETESAWVYVWNTTTPTVCPNNNSHTINTGSITIVGVEQSDGIDLKQTHLVDPETCSSIERGKKITTQIGVNPSVFSIYLPYTVDRMGGFMYDTNIEMGDYINGYATLVDDDPIGTLPDGASIDDTSITVSTPVLSYIKVGDFVKIGTDTQFYEITSKSGNTLGILPAMETNQGSNTNVYMRACWMYERYIYPNEMNEFCKRISRPKGITSDFEIRIEYHHKTTPILVRNIYFNCIYRY